MIEVLEEDTIQCIFDELDRVDPNADGGNATCKRSYRDLNAAERERVLKVAKDFEKRKIGAATDIRLIYSLSNTFRLQGREITLAPHLQRYCSMNVNYAEKFLSYMKYAHGLVQPQWSWVGGNGLKPLSSVYQRIICRRICPRFLTS